MNLNNNIVEAGVNEGRRTNGRAGGASPQKLDNNNNKTKKEDGATLNQQHPPAHYDG
jgi:hypothetical protein